VIRYLFHDEVVTRDELFATAAAFTVVSRLVGLAISRSTKG